VPRWPARLARRFSGWKGQGEITKRKRGRTTSVVALGRSARAIAERLGEMLVQRDMVGGVDGSAIELAADALARFAAARRIVDREGLFVEVTTRNGEVVRFVHPGIRIMQSERDAAMCYLRQLGTTPKTRGELRRIGSEGAKVDLDSFLGFGGGRRAGNGASPTRGRGRRPSLSGSAAGWCVAASPLPRPL